MSDSTPQRFFSTLDRHFAGFITGRQPGAGGDLFLAAALVSRAAADGNVCLGLEELAGKCLPDESGAETREQCPPLDLWVRALRSSPAVGSPGQRRPLILDARNRLYLFRYWEYEQTLVHSLRSRCGAALETADIEPVQEAMARVFPTLCSRDELPQRIAAAVAALRPICVITGGPGTGKTFAIARLLALLAEIQPARPPRVLLTAPTGKAAARLKESLQTDRARTLTAGSPETPLLPPEVGTLHRLLRPVPGSPYFKHNRSNPLPADVVIVDEASMVDLALMAKLLDALRPEAKLVLVGDKDQLSSVEAGSVLGDICDRGRDGGFSMEMAAALTRVTGSEVRGAPIAAPGLRDSIVELQKSYRFAPGSAIGELSRAVNNGDFERAADILGDPGSGSVRWLDPRIHSHAVLELEKAILEGYQGSFEAPGPREALQRHGDFKILCAHKSGALGAAGINRWAEELFLKNRLIRSTDRRFFPWYSGRPVLVVRNDYNLELFNGDLGVSWVEPSTQSGHFAVYFAGPAGGMRRLAPYRLPEHETVYAMTVHKSQGSEYEHVLLVLPERDSPVLTRELVYTALTRARKTITLYGSRAVLRAALSRRIERASGLHEALWVA